jgi:hypothetical protein
MPSGQYIRSEHFIHDELARRAELLVKDALAVWRKRRKIDTYAATWSGEPVKDDGGKEIDVTLCPLSAGLARAELLRVLQQLVERTKAYGLVVVEQRENSIRVLFETRHGSRSWYIPLAWHGDVQVPGQAEVKNNDECVGLLWRKGSQH